jgi:hypothetical protein
MAAQGCVVAVKVLGYMWPQDSHQVVGHPVALWSGKQPVLPPIEGPVNMSSFVEHGLCYTEVAVFRMTTTNSLQTVTVTIIRDLCGES